MDAEYEVIVSPGGHVKVNLLKESANQIETCKNVQQLVNSLGRVTQHDQGCDSPQPVNINLNIPGV